MRAPVLDLEKGWWKNPAQVRPRRGRQIVPSPYCPPGRAFVTDELVIAHPTTCELLAHPNDISTRCAAALAGLQWAIEEAFQPILDALNLGMETR